MLKNRIKKVREVLNIGSQEEFSEITSFPLSRIKDLERGKVKALKSEEAVFLEDKFHFSGWWLLTGKGEMLLKEVAESVKSEEPTPKRTIIDARDILEHHISDKELEILEAYRSLPQKRQELIYYKLKAEEIEYGNQKGDLGDVKYA